MTQTIIWTALPKSYDPGSHTLRLSVRVSPRLDTGGPDAFLEAFPDFKTWASTQLNFRVQCGSLPPVEAKLDGDPRDPKLWEKIFPASTTLVMNHQFDQALVNSRIHSFPVGHVLDYLKSAYQKVGVAHPETLPHHSHLVGGREEGVGLLNDIEPLGNLEREKQRLEREFGDAKFIPSGNPNPRMDLLQALLFHEAQNGAFDTPVPRPTLDFHRTLSMLEESDPLLRRLGLVFDLVCPLPTGIEHLPPGDCRLRVIPTWAPRMPQATPPDIRPWTAFDLDLSAGRFSARPTSDTWREGFLDLSGEAFEIAQVDVDGAALKLVNTVVNLAMLQAAPPTELLPEQAGLPALRTSGISVFQTGRAGALWNKFQQAKELNANLGDDLCFSAEDLVRGFRVDVLPELADAHWRSLCWREESYSVRSEPGGPKELQFSAQREGSVGAAVSSHAASPQELKLHESLFHWDGWSLAVRRPGNAVPDPALSSEYAADASPDQGDALGLIVDLGLPRTQEGKILGTLPRLRFGRSYRLRARSVDLAGNGPALEEKDHRPTGATRSVTYRRFEPVPSPTLARTSDYVPGESMERIVIRSADAVKDRTPLCARYILPPRTSQQSAELHGMFDGSAPAAGWYETLKARHGRGALLGQKGETKDAFDDLLPSAPTDVPYLPDPLAHSLALRGLPGETEPRLLSFQHPQAWPSAAPLSLALIEGSGSPAWDEGSRTLTVQLPPAGTLTLRASCGLPPKQDLNLLGLWNWISEAASAQRLPLLEGLARNGGHWMLTPGRVLKLVHAVQRPCEAPALEGFFPLRKLGESFVQLFGQVRVHGASTGKVELRASWQDRVDAQTPGTGAELSPQHASHAFDLANADPAATFLACEGRRHEFGDTRYRRVSYEVKATSCFREYFDPAMLAERFTSTSTETLEVDILNSARPASPQVQYLVPTFGWERSEDPKGIASQRRGGLRVYLDRPWFSSGDGELLGVVIAHGPVHRVAPCVVPEHLKGYVTQWGFDPIWVSHPATQLPTVQDFPLAVAKESGVTLEEAASLPLDPSSWWLSVAGHEVAFDPDRQLWYSDIEMELGPAYFPFVRLALARYQPKSVQGAELSKVILADFIQVAPERLAWVTPVPDNPFLVQVSVSGPAPLQGQGRLLTPSSMMVRAEALHPGEGEELWLPLEPGWQLMDRTQITSSATVWSGLVPLPSPRGSRRFRLQVCEMETFRSVGEREGVRGVAALPGGAGFRPTYMDAIEI